MSNQLKLFSSTTTNRTNRQKFVMCKTTSDKQSFAGNLLIIFILLRIMHIISKFACFQLLVAGGKRQLINMIFFMKCEHHTMSLTVFRGISKKSGMDVITENCWWAGQWLVWCPWYFYSRGATFISVETKSMEFQSGVVQFSGRCSHRFEFFLKHSHPNHIFC